MLSHQTLDEKRLLLMNPFETNVLQKRTTIQTVANDTTIIRIVCTSLLQNVKLQYQHKSQATPFSKNTFIKQIYFLMQSHQTLDEKRLLLMNPFETNVLQIRTTIQTVANDITIMRIVSASLLRYVKLQYLNIQIKQPHFQKKHFH